VSLGQTHFFDAAFASGELFLAENDSERDGALLGGLELLGKLGLQLVVEFGLENGMLVDVHSEMIVM
jgi:hypothetical protein